MEKEQNKKSEEDILTREEEEDIIADRLARLFLEQIKKARDKS